MPGLEITYPVTTWTWYGDPAWVFELLRTLGGIWNYIEIGVESALRILP